MYLRVIQIKPYRLSQTLGKWPDKYGQDSSQQLLSVPGLAGLAQGAADHLREAQSGNQKLFEFWKVWR